VHTLQRLGRQRAVVGEAAAVLVPPLTAPAPDTAAATLHHHPTLYITRWELIN